MKIEKRNQLVKVNLAVMWEWGVGRGRERQKKNLNWPTDWLTDRLTDWSTNRDCQAHAAWKNEIKTVADWMSELEKKSNLKILERQ